MIENQCFLHFCNSILPEELDTKVYQNPKAEGKKTGIQKMTNSNTESSRIPFPSVALDLVISREARRFYMHP